MTIETLTAVFGWMTLINAALLLFSTLMAWLMRDMGIRLHVNMFGLDRARTAAEWYHFLGTYKLAIIMLNLVPYLSLRIVGQPPWG